MRTADWIVLIGSISAIVSYGIWKGRGSKNVRGYLLSNRDMKWYTIALSVMATQASAITFLSTPGQAYVDGMRFVQFYFGLPIAMVILSMTAVPLYHKLNVYTAYEYLEKRFDLKTRSLAAVLFLIQRGLAAGFTIYAPSIILSTLLGWNLYITNLVVGSVVILYTATGGSKAVSWTQFQQMLVITFGMAAAFGMIIHLLPEGVGFVDALHIAGKSGKLNAIDTSFDINNRYNLWSGLIGGLFLQLSYFGTDQSQVQRYLTGKSVAHSRMGLLFNGMAKIPMQFSILLIGAMLFVFYQFVMPPMFFDSVEVEKIQQSRYAGEYAALEEEFGKSFERRKGVLGDLVTAIRDGDEKKTADLEKQAGESARKMSALRAESIRLIEKNDPDANTNDTNYIFLTFVIAFLPAGLVGLVLAAILSASMSSTSSEINALASTTVIDIYRRMIRRDASDKHYLIVSKTATVLWGCLAILFAEFANYMGSLIEAVNILGSLFYGTILGIFLLAFFFKSIRGTAAFTAACIAEILVLYCFLFTDISFLWYNVVGSLAVVGIALLLETGKRYRLIQSPD